VRLRADELTRARRCAAVCRDQDAGGGDDLQGRFADPDAHRHRLPGQGRLDAVTVVLEADQRARGDDALDPQLGRVRRRRQRQQRLSRRILRDGEGAAAPLVSDLDAPRIERALRASADVATRAVRHQERPR
jgi:hypothetical protein